jgi:site-specific recombinase
VRQNQPLDTKVSGLVANLVIGQVRGLHELVPALVGLVLERSEDAIARIMASLSAGAGLLGIQVHIIELITGTHC